MLRALSLLAVVVVVASTGCSRPTDQSDGPRQSGREPAPSASSHAGSTVPNDTSKTPDAVVAVSVMTMTNPFFCDLAEAMKQQAAQHNFRVIVTSGEYNVANQRDQINEFIVQKVDAIVLCPCDSKAIGPSIIKANEAGIPVFTADVKCLAEGAKVVCHVATDNLGGGRKAAETMIQLLGGKGRVAIIDFPEVESVLMRTTGFGEIIKKAPGIEVVGSWPGGGDRQKSYKVTEDILQAHPDLDAIFAINDPSGLGAATAVEKAGKQDRVKIIAFDAQPIGRRGVKEGKLYATIVQYPEKIGAQAIDAVARYLAAEEVEPEILIPCTVYRQVDAEADPTLQDAR